MPLLDQAPSSFESYLQLGGGRGLEQALASSPEAVIEEVGRSGLRGRGGAGFPTGEKWRSVRTTGTGTRYMVCNAAEGEPATFKDRMLLRTNPYQVLEGLAIAAYAVGAESAFFGLKEAFRPELDAVGRAIDEMSAAGALGPVPIWIALGPDHYLLGEETGLLEVIEGRDPLPRTARPYMLGLSGTSTSENPTCVNNVETLANVPWIIAEGADWLRASGTSGSPGTMCMTVTGDVRREGVFEVPLGTSMRDLLYDAAGGPFEGREFKVVFPGASSTAITPPEFETPLDFDAMRAVGSGLGAGGLAVYDDSTCIVEVALLFCRFLYVESCGQCPPCKFGSGEITAYLERLERGEGELGHLDIMLARAKGVTDGQKCALPTGTSLLAQSLLQLFGEEFRRHVMAPCPRHRDLALPKITDFDPDAARFTYDETWAKKRPDWTYAP
ncbi:MAG TPA: NADH-ubiquinone oxidoreductase-F iron-sulfur binding region domain-containing protein [Actinomycetota bacterium]